MSEFSKSIPAEHNAYLTRYAHMLSEDLNDKPYSLEREYAHSLDNILKNGTWKANRTGIDTIAVQHSYFYMPDIANNFPVLRAKKVYPKMALKELIWMLMGRNDVQWLRDHGVTYWDEWEWPDGTIGRSYGYQYRNFNGHDQVSALVDTMLRDPLGRRHIISLWNSADLDKMALPPCMYDFHFSCEPALDNPNKFKVSLHSHLRSNDSFLGAPYDFMFCGFFLIILCTYLSAKSDTNEYVPGDIHYTADDYHMYSNHMEAVLQYRQNFNEDKNACVTISSICKFTPDLDKVKDMSLDDYLQYVIDNHRDILKVEYSAPIADNFTYGPIKADIAV